MPHCARRLPSRPSAITERTLRFLRIQGPTTRQFLTMDYDIIYMICQDLNVQTLKAITHIPGQWQYEAQRRLLQAIDYHAHVCTSRVNPGLDEDSLTFKCCTIERRRALYGDLRPVRVQDIRRLTEYLRANVQLTKYVQHAFICRDQDWCEEIDHLVKVLQHAGSLERLHVTGHIRPQLSYLQTASQFLTSAHIDFSIPAVAKAILPQHMRSLFQVPSITSMHLSHFPFNNVSDWSRYAAPSTSPITTLALTNGIPTRTALTTILHWLRRLTSLHVEFNHESDFNASGLGLREFVATLSRHATSLTQMHFRSMLGPWDFPLLDEYQPRLRYADTLIQTTSFTNFSALKELDVQFCMICNIPRHSSQELVDEAYDSLGPAWRWLPGSLETLTLRVREPYSWGPNSAVPDTLVQPQTPYTDNRFTGWLSNILKDKEQRFPSLNAVKILRHVGQGIFLPRHDSKFHDTNSEARWAAVRAYWAGRGVKLELMVRNFEEKKERGDVIRCGCEEWTDL